MSDEATFKNHHTYEWRSYWLIIIKTLVALFTLQTPRFLFVSPFTLPQKPQRRPTREHQRSRDKNCDFTLSTIYTGKNRDFSQEVFKKPTTEEWFFWRGFSVCCGMLPSNFHPKIAILEKTWFLLCSGNATIDKNKNSLTKAWYSKDVRV